MPNKKRVLFVGEASFLATGFSTYWNEVIKRIHTTGEFEIAEMGSYANENDPRIHQVPWRFYPVGPDPKNPASIQAYNSKVTNQFGEWKFEDVLLDFRPDIVADIRDHWMSEFQDRSPYRNYYKLIQMPTVDGSPQRTQWLDTYSRLDTCLTYSNWGKETLESESGGRIKVKAVASPGADLDVFKPVPDKREHKQRCGIDPDTNIIGTVMRNQQRKLYHDLIDAFADWLRTCHNRRQFDLVRKSYLYLHTSYPDVGYDIGKAIRKNKVGNKVLMTYVCSKCGVSYPAFFSGEWAHCRRCGQPSAHPPNSNHFVPRETLAGIMNLFDVYVQYSISEGWGMPITDSMACGVPIMAVDYSAMKDHINTPGGIPINVERYFYESVIQTEQRRALPDNKHLGQQLTKFFKMNPEKRAELARRTRAYIEEPTEVYGQSEKLPRFSWDRTAAIWANIFRETQVPDHSETWLRPEPFLVKPNLNQPRPDLNNVEFVRWAITSVMCQPKLARSELANEWIKALNCGFRIENNQQIPFDRNAMIQSCLNIAETRNRAELNRVARLQSVDPNAISFRVI